MLRSLPLLIIFLYSPILSTWGGQEQTTREQPELYHALKEDTLFYLHLPAWKTSKKNIAGASIHKLLSNPETDKYLQQLWQDKQALVKAILENLTPPSLDIALREAELKIKSQIYSELLNIMTGEISIGFDDWPVRQEQLWLHFQITLNRSFSPEALFALCSQLNKTRKNFVTKKNNLLIFNTNPRLYLKISGTRLIGSTSKIYLSGTLLPALTKSEKSNSLATNQDFLKLRGLVTRNQKSTFLFLNLQKIIAENRQPLWSSKAIWRIMGIDKIRAIAAGSPKDNLPGIFHKLYFYIPGKKSGMLSLFKNNPAPSAHQQAIRDGSDFCLTINISPALLFQQLYQKLVQLLPKRGKIITDEILNKISAASNFKSNKESSSLFKPSISIFSGRTNTAPRLFPPDLILRLEPENKKLVQIFLSSVKLGTGSYTWRHLKTDNDTIFYLNRFSAALPIAPAYVLRKDELLIAPYPQLLWRQLNLKQQPEQVRLTSGTKNSDASRHNNSGSILLDISSQDEMPVLIDNIISLLYALRSITGVNADPGQLRCAEERQIAWSASSVYLQSEKDGLSLDCYGPVGAFSVPLWLAGHYARSFTGTDGILHSAMLFGLLWPTIYSQNEKYKQQLSLMRLKQIGSAYMIYYKNKGHYPHALQELVKSGYLTGESIVYPLGYADYNYALLSIKDKLTPTTPLVHEPLLRESQGVYVMFGDRHIEWIARWRIEKILGILPDQLDK